MNLVIVESPAKAKTINKYLGDNYTVLASYGHIRDLPSKNGSVDPEQNFKMEWEVDSFSKKYLKEITDAAKNSNKPALSDDSGFSEKILDGAPGVYSADWAETANGRNFSLAMEKVWNKVQYAEKPCKAKFCCTLCLAWPDGHDEIFEGSIHGEIAWPPRGDNGFGYDPMFIADGMNQTFGEMQPKDKHLISHRADAFNKLIKVFQKE